MKSIPIGGKIKTFIYSVFFSLAHIEHEKEFQINFKFVLDVCWWIHSNDRPNLHICHIFFDSFCQCADSVFLSSIFDSQTIVKMSINQF